VNKGALSAGKTEASPDALQTALQIDPVAALLELIRRLTPEQRVAVRKAMGNPDPLLDQSGTQHGALLHALERGAAKSAATLLEQVLALTLRTRPNRSSSVWIGIGRDLMRPQWPNTHHPRSRPPKRLSRPGRALPTQPGLQAQARPIRRNYRPAVRTRCAHKSSCPLL
jgi:hypothetical protein